MLVSIIEVSSGILLAEDSRSAYSTDADFPGSYVKVR